MASIPSTHSAVASIAARRPLVIIERPRVAPKAGEVVVHVEWTSSTPLDLHQADGGLLVTYPHVMGSSFAGTVVQCGPPPPDGTPSHATPDVQVGEKVFGMAWRSLQERCHQEYITIPTHILGRLPKNLAMQEAVTAPANLVTVLHSMTKDLGLQFPWPLPEGWTPAPEVRSAPILVWGSASSVGMFAVQVLRYWGYKAVLAVASGKHHAMLRELGASACFDYREPAVADAILAHVGAVSADMGPRVPFVLDCIGSLEGTLKPLAEIAEAGTKVAVMLPVILKDATVDEAPDYEMDVTKCRVGEWKDGVELRGVRTHFYMEDEYFKYHMQPDIMPGLLEQRVVLPNEQLVVEGKTLLDRAQRALHMLRDRAPSGQKLVWRVAEE